MSAALPELTVVVPSYRDAEKLDALLASLGRQTLASEAFEIIVIDDGNEPALQTKAVWPSNTKLVRQRHAGPAAARNMALRHARAAILLFVNADAILAVDALERHLAHHTAGGKPRAVMGRFDWLPEHRNALVRLATRARVLFPYDLLSLDTSNPFWAFWTGNLSIPTASVRAVGGFDESFARPMWEDVELGYRLELHGVPLHYDPKIGCDHDHAISVDGWVRHAQWFGHEWVRFARKHGASVFPILGGDDEPTEAFAQQCLAGLLHQHDANLGRVRDLKHALQSLDDAIVKAPDRADAIIAAESEAAMALFVAVNTIARMAGISGAIWEHDPDELGRRAKTFARPVVVATVAGEWDLLTVSRLRDILGPDGRLLVASYIYLPPGAIPEDSRVQTVRIPRSLPAAKMWRPVLDATDAHALIFVEGTQIPTARAIATLSRYLAVSPWVGAIGLASAQGLPHASGRLVDAVPRHVVATTRRVLELDPGGPGSFLDRLGQRALYQVALTLGGN
jgi:GT2 family glycosyltransferase